MTQHRPPEPRGECPVCSRRYRLTRDGYVYRHPADSVSDCLGSGDEPVPGTVKPNPADVEKDVHWGRVTVVFAVTVVVAVAIAVGLRYTGIAPDWMLIR